MQILQVLGFARNLPRGVGSSEPSNFSNVLEFNNLHLTENLKKAKDSLNGFAGIYCIKCIETGAIYIGSSVNLAVRIMDHIFYGSSNIYLKNAIAKYGVENFVFSVLEFYELNPDFSFPPIATGKGRDRCLYGQRQAGTQPFPVALEVHKAALLEREQHYLNILF